MVAELDTETKGCDKIDNEDGILFNRISSKNNVESPAEAHQLEEYIEHTKGDPERDLNGTQDLDRNEDSCESKHDILGKDTCDVCVLIIIHIEQTVTEYNRWFFDFSCKVSTEAEHIQ